MRLQPIKFHLKFRDNLESKVVPAVGARTNHPFEERRKVPRSAAEFVPDSADPGRVAEPVPGDYTSLVLACLSSPTVKAIQHLRVFAPASQVAVRHGINEIRVGRIALEAALLVTITKDKCVESHFVLSIATHVVPVFHLRVEESHPPFGEAPSQMGRFSERKIYRIRNHARTMTDMAITGKALRAQRQLDQCVRILNSL